MPDLVTHVALSHLLRRPFNFTRNETNPVPFIILFYFGTILPDILTRPFYILFPVTKDWTVPFHTPFGMILTCVLLAFLFEASIRRKVFINLLGGAFFHFFLDALQKHVNEGIFWFFPFSWKSGGFQFLWADKIMNLIPVWIILIIILEATIFIRRKQIKKHSRI
jgi:hypothetical protein